MSRVVVFGNGVFAELMGYLLSHDSEHEVVGFTVDRTYLKRDRVLGRPVVPFETVNATFPPTEFDMIVPISFQRVNRLRAAKYSEAKDMGYRLVNYVSSRAVTYPDLMIGDNCVILENAVVAPFVEIGKDVTVASSAIVGHHSLLMDHCFVAPGAVILGNVTVGEYSLVGANATIREEVTVAPESLIGSGVAISRDTQEHGVYLNSPPRPLAKRSNELRTWLMWPVRSGRGSCNPADGQ
jgi:sugar O-acyltransferase (sialic acid O-acetyltransferase NeuD family)